MKSIEIPGTAMLRGFVVAVLITSAPWVHAKELHRCNSADGGTIFSDKPCPPPQGVARRDPVPTASAPIGKGDLTPAERKAIVDRMNAEVSVGLARRGRQQAEEEARLAALPKPVSTSEAMPFDACRRVVARTLLAVAGRMHTEQIVNAPGLTSHKICTIDGNVILTCTKAGERFIKTLSPYSC